MIQIPKKFGCAAGCALCWCYPIKNVMKKITRLCIFFDEEGAKFSSGKTVGTGFWSGICYLLNLPNGW